MLAEKLMAVPTLKIIQINTDGITYYIHKDNEPMAAQVTLCNNIEDFPLKMSITSGIIKRRVN